MMMSCILGEAKNQRPQWRVHDNLKKAHWCIHVTWLRYRISWTKCLASTISCLRDIIELYFFCLQDRAGHLSQGAIANLVDVVGASVGYINGLPMNVSVDISISYMSKAKLDVSNPFPTYMVIHSIRWIGHTRLPGFLEYVPNSHF